MRALYSSFSWWSVIAAVGAAAAVALRRLRRPKVVLEEMESAVTR